MAELVQGMDFRLPEHRREVFLRFYTWSLRYASFPGGVHYVLPHLARAYDWDTEQRYWFAWLNGNTQNPVTSLLLMEASDHDPRRWSAAVDFWRVHFRSLSWDTDRRHQKGKFREATERYAHLTAGDGLRRYYRPCQDWTDYWATASALPYLGRLSTWSYLEYLKILGLMAPEAETLLLEDIPGSRSHRNGLALVLGHDHLIVDHQLGRPGITDLVYTPEVMSFLGDEAYRLIKEARDRSPSVHAGYLSLESALCTYKSWHKPDRRYPGVYNDLLHDRIKSGEIRFGSRFGALWDARRAALPSRLLLEDQPFDPGCTSVKQNWYLRTGQVINMTEDWPCFANGFEVKVAQGAFGERPERWI